MYIFHVKTMTIFIQRCVIILFFCVYCVYGRHSEFLEREKVKVTENFNDDPESDILPEVSAVLLKCPKPRKTKMWQETEEKPQENCETQLMVNIRVNPSFHVEKIDKFLVLDEVFDPRSSTKAKILSPYLIEISRGEPVMMYPLEFTKVNRIKYSRIRIVGLNENCNRSTIFSR